MTLFKFLVCLWHRLLFRALDRFQLKIVKIVTLLVPQSRVPMTLVVLLRMIYFCFCTTPFFSGVWPLWPQQWPCRICYWCSQLWAELSFSLLLTHSSGWFCCCRWVVMMTSILPNLLVQNGDDPAQLITCCNFHIFHTQIFFQLFLQLLSKSLLYLSSWIVNFNTN